MSRPGCVPTKARARTLRQWDGVCKIWRYNGEKESVLGVDGVDDDDDNDDDDDDDDSEDEYGVSFAKEGQKTSDRLQAMLVDRSETQRAADFVRRIFS